MGGIALRIAWFQSTALTLCCMCASVAFAGSPAPPARSAAFDDQKLAGVKVGTTTRAEVGALLGQPNRIAQFADDDEPGSEIWEYRGIDAEGKFRVHIEFDQKHLVTVVKKIRETAT
jgi:hypothetical protein